MNATRQHRCRVLILTHADTDAAVFRTALLSLGEQFAGSAVVPLQHVKAERQLADLIQPATIFICRLLGNIAETPGLTEFFREAQASQSALIVLSGTQERKPEFESLSTVDAEVVENLWLYLTFGGSDNACQMLLYLSNRLAGSGADFKAPQVVPDFGIYHPRLGAGASIDDWRSISDPQRPTIGIHFYRAHWLSGNTGFVDCLIDAFDAHELNCLPVFSSSARLADEPLPPSYSLFKGENGLPIVDVIVTTTSFAIGDGGGEGLKSLDVPLLQAVCNSMTEGQWRASSRGLSALDTAMNIAMPEFDGRIITFPISCKQSALDDAAEMLYKPLPERIQRLVQQVQRLVALRRKPNRQKRVAFVLTNASSKASQIGNAVGLDAPESLVRLLACMAERGYEIDHQRFAADGLIRELIDRCSYDQTVLTESQCGRALANVPAAVYEQWFAELPPDCQAKMVAQWGPAPGDAYLHKGCLVIAGIELGNAIVILQPPRGYGMDPNAIYHQPDLPPTHHYFAAYRWLCETWRADAIVHVGKHGTVEWLPGKGVGLSGSCFPDVFIGDMPIVYPFIINDPGEGSQSKRRTHAVIVDHLPPPLTTADTYGVLSELTELVDEYYRCEALDPTKLPLLRQQIWELVKDAKLDQDLELIMDHDHDDHESGLPPAGTDDEDDHWDPTLTEEGVPVTLSTMDSVAVSHMVQEIDGYLCELGLAQIRDGLHILGNAPAGDALIDTLACITRLPNDGVSGMHAALAGLFGFSMDRALDRRGSKLENSADLTRLSELVAVPIVTAADAITAVDDLTKQLFRWLLRHNFQPSSIDGCIGDVLGVSDPSAAAEIRRILEFACRQLVPNLQKTSDEIDAVIGALDGRYTPAGPSGSPSRGMAHILPTGRNFYSVDPRSVPSPAAWTVGKHLADEVVDRFHKETGQYPESVSISAWGTSAMRTHGDDVAEILALLGVQPQWQKGSSRVGGLEVIPLAELGRPRIDVTTRISGLFRDAFPQLIALIDQAVNLVIDRVDETPDMNFVRKHYLEQAEQLSQQGLRQREADQRSRYRIFGSKPGSYGAGLLGLIQEQNWQDQNDLAEVYLNWGSFAYTARENGTEAREDFSQRLRIVDVAVHNQDNREHDIFDSDDYFQFHGGLIATVRALSGRTPKGYFGDSHNPARPQVRDLRQETLRVFRSRVVNPKWIESIKKHGYKGGLELSATVDYLFGYDATAEVMQDWMYEQVAQKYALDESMQQFLQAVNPWALKAMAERLLEAAGRKMWKHPDPETIEALKQAYLQTECSLEARTDRQRSAAEVP